MSKIISIVLPVLVLLLKSHIGNTQATSHGIQPVIAGVVKDAYIPAPFENQRIHGIIGERMDANLYKRLLQIDQAAILSGFLLRPGTQDWIGEHIGKFLDAACSTWRYSHNEELKMLIDKMLFSLVSVQKDDGYLGTYTPDKYWTSWDVWVHKYDLVGLLACYKTFGYQSALIAAKKIGDLLLTTFGKNHGQLDLMASGEHVGMASASLLDPLTDLYSYTGELKYLEFANYIVGAYDQANGPKIINTLLQTGEVNKVANSKAYEMLSNLVGVVKLYRITGKTDLIRAVENAWEDIVNNRLYITGTASSFERFQAKDELPAGEKDDMGEGCVTTTWIQLNFQLFTLIGATKYMDQVEKSVYNHLLAAENPESGCVSYYTSLMNKKPYSCDLSCCLSSVPRGIAMIPEFNYGKLKGIPTLLLLESTEIEDSVLTDNHQLIPLSIKAISEFPHDGRILYTVSPSEKARFALSVRVPVWATTFTALIDGKKYTGNPGTYLTISKEWHCNEKLTIFFELPVKIIRGGHNYKNSIAIQRGPQILSVDSSLNPTTAIQMKSQSIQDHKIIVRENNSLLPSGWIGHQAYILKSASNQDKKNQLVLVPFADAGQTGAKLQVWIPVK